MATSLIVEEDSGTSAGRTHAHKGYYAGDFNARPAVQTSGCLQTSRTRATTAR
jgi:hypothetical protein